jgi:hypothetical protein
MRRSAALLGVLAAVFVPSAGAQGRPLSSDDSTAVAWTTALAAVGAFLTAAAIPITAFYRRPSLTLHEDEHRLHSRVECNGLPYIRLIVRNRRGRRTARNARGFVAQYAQNGVAGSDTTMGSPDLGWTASSTRRALFCLEASDQSTSARLNLGTAYLRAHPNGYRIKLELGAEDGPARSYDVHVNWDGTAQDERAALASVEVEVRKA